MLQCGKVVDFSQSFCYFQSKNRSNVKLHEQTWINYASDVDQTRSVVQNVWGAPDFSSAHTLRCKTEVNIRSVTFSRIGKVMK